MTTTHREPSARDLRIFAGLWLLFFAAVGGMAWWRPRGLLGAAVVLSIAWLVGVAVQRGDARRFLGILLPAAFAGAGQAALAGAPGPVLLGVGGAIGLIGAAAVLASPALGRAIHGGWTAAAEPIGFTISNVVLALVFFAVMMPIGLVIRLLGRDPLERRLDRSAPTYWHPRRPAANRARYFRQF